MISPTIINGKPVLPKRNSNLSMVKNHRVNIISYVDEKYDRLYLVKEIIYVHVRASLRFEKYR